MTFKAKERNILVFVEASNHWITCSNIHLWFPGPDAVKLQWSYYYEFGSSGMYGEESEGIKMIFLFSLGPFGERDDQQVFIQKVVPITNKLFVRLSSTGKRYLHD